MFFRGGKGLGDTLVAFFYLIFSYECNICYVKIKCNNSFNKYCLFQYIMFFFFNLRFITMILVIYCIIWWYITIYYKTMSLIIFLRKIIIHMYITELSGLCMFEELQFTFKEYNVFFFKLILYKYKILVK